MRDCFAYWRVAIQILWSRPSFWNWTPVVSSARKGRRKPMSGPFVTPLDPRTENVSGGRGTGPNMGPPRAPFKWECKACGVEHVTRFEDGCPACGTGTPGQVPVAPPVSTASVDTAGVFGLRDAYDYNAWQGMAIILCKVPREVMAAALEFYLAQGNLDEPNAERLRLVVDALTQPDTVESYTLEEVAETLALGTRALKTLAERGSGPPCELRDGVPTYPKAAFDEWLAKKYA